MHNNYFFLRHYAQELNTVLKGETLVMCFSQVKDEVILEFSNNLYLKCILQPQFSTCVLLNEYSRARKNSITLWQDLQGLKILNISTFENERAVGLFFENQITFVLKFFGNRPNLLIYKDTNLVYIFNNQLLTDKQLSLSEFNRTAQFSFEEFKNHNGDIKKVFYTFGKPIIEHLKPLIEGIDLAGKWKVIHDTLIYLQNPSVYLSHDDDLPQISLFEGTKQENAIKAAQIFVQSYLKLTAFTQLKKSSILNLEKELAKTSHYITTTSLKLEELKNSTKNEEIGNIIMANLHNIKTGKKEVELFNFYTSQPILIKLKIELSPQKNAEVYYRKSKNEKIEFETLASNLNKAEQKKTKLTSQILKIELTKSLTELREVIKVNHKPVKQIDTLPFREFIYKGIKIWVGKNAKNNDLLLASTHKDDWWLHARDTSGSHVIIKNSKPTEEILEYAASLAAYYSKSKTEKLVAVTYTQKKYVRKAKNLAAGQVILDREQTILIEPKEK